MRISPHFHRHEFECHCGCGFDVVDAALLAILEDVRVHFNKPVVITSGARCKKRNKDQGGAKDSQHLLGKAADIIVKETAPSIITEYLEWKYPFKHGIGTYRGVTHIDCRDEKARWDRT